jgi:hypothetical protein
LHHAQTSFYYWVSLPLDQMWCDIYSTMRLIDWMVKTRLCVVQNLSHLCIIDLAFGVRVIFFSQVLFCYHVICIMLLPSFSNNWSLSKNMCVTQGTFSPLNRLFLYARVRYQTHNHLLKGVVSLNFLDQSIVGKTKFLKKNRNIRST